MSLSKGWIDLSFVVDFQSISVVRSAILYILHMYYTHQCYVIVRPLSTVGYKSVVASVIHSRQWSN